MEVSNSNSQLVTRWWDDYKGYCPFTSEPIHFDPETKQPIFEGDCTWLFCNIDDKPIEVTSV